MKIVVYGPEKRTGVLDKNSVIDIQGACAKYLAERKNERNADAMAEAVASADLARYIEGGDRALDETKRALSYLAKGAANKLGIHGQPLVCKAADTQLHAPRPNNARIACAGGNFADHAAAMSRRSQGGSGSLRPVSDAEAYRAIRKMGIWGFWKLGRECVGPGGQIIYPDRAPVLDWEGELAIVIGKQGKDIKAGRIRDYIWGVTLLGDWSVRLAPEPGPMKFVLAKNFDTSCSLGPCIAVGEVDALKADVETRINGRVRQKYNTRSMVFSFGEYLAHLSRDFTFYPGDIISGGTAAGTAADSSPIDKNGKPRASYFLQPGDRVEVRNSKIGSLSASVVAKNGAGRSRRPARKRAKR